MNALEHRGRYLAAALLAAYCLAQAASPVAADSISDSRQVFSNSSPHWLRAVGKLQVPGSKYRDGRRRHHREDCSATLVANGSSGKSDTILTAWHCLESYNDISKPITFSLPGDAQQSPSREAYRVADGGGMGADWAILRLYKAIPGEVATAVRIDGTRADPERPIAMAGFSRDSGMGDRGEQLTFDANCKITRQQRTSSNSDCWAYKGASGGAVVQISEGGTPLLCGVISEGDSAGFSTYVPVSLFHSAIKQHIR